MREGPARIKGQRREHQEDGSMEVVVQTSALFLVEVRIVDQVNAGLLELRADTVA